MISNIYSQPSNNYSNKTSFKAIPLGRYKHAKNAVVDVIQLEKSDLPYIKRFCENIGDYYQKHQITDPARQEIIRDSFNSARDILSSDNKLFDDTKILVGVSNKDIHGIIIGNIPKHGKNGEVHYSTRKNHAKNERELDWFVSWNAKGVGKSLVSEFFKSMKEYPFKKIFVRSEVPEKSSAQDIYEHFGFKQISKRSDIVKKTSNIDINEEGLETEMSDIIPMAISRAEANKTEQKISKQCQREELNKVSRTLEEITGQNDPKYIEFTRKLNLGNGSEENPFRIAS